VPVTQHWEDVSELAGSRLLHTSLDVCRRSARSDTFGSVHRERERTKFLGHDAARLWENPEHTVIIWRVTRDVKTSAFGSLPLMLPLGNLYLIARKPV